MNNSKINKTLLIVVIALLAVGLYMIMGKKENSVPIINDSQSTPTLVSTVPVVNMNSDVTAWNKVTEESGMSVMVPEGYATNTNVPHAILGRGVGLNVTNHDKNVISITKFSTQDLYDDSAPSGVRGDDYILVNSNYSIGGMTGIYYDRKDGSGHLIAVPSVFVIVYVEPISFSGISQEMLNKMLASIQL